MGVAHTPRNRPSRSNEELHALLRVAVYHGVFWDVGLVYCVSFLAPDFLQDLGKLHARQIQGGSLAIYVRAFQGVGLEGAVGSNVSLSSATSPANDELGLLRCVHAVDTACTDLEVTHGFLGETPTQPSVLRACITRLKKCATNTLQGLAQDLLNQALVVCAPDGASSTGECSSLSRLVLVALSLPAPLPTEPFDFTVRCIELTEPLARVGGHQQGELIQGWQLCGSYVQLVVLRALYRD